MSAVLSVNPAKPDDVVLEAEAAGAREVDEAVGRAHEAFPAWAASAAGRAVALEQLAQAIEARADELATLICREVGKPITEAKGEVARAVAIVRYHAQSSLDADGETYPEGPGVSLLMARRRPRGVAALITPWNFPLAIPLWKAAPALAAGNSVVIKPASQAAGCGAALASLFEAALPPHVAQVTLGGAAAGSALVDHPQVGCLSFTGSSAVGAKLIGQAAGRALPIQAEMGGQNPSVVLADADLEMAASTIAAAAMGYAGQKCTATSRVIVESGAADEFAERLTTAVAALPVGDPGDPATAVGPLIDEPARDGALAAVKQSLDAGGSLLHGGSALEPGWTMAPTLVQVAGPADGLAQDEVFAPVAALVGATDEDEAVHIANGVRYGLSAAVFTRSLDRALRVADRLEAGMTRVNQSTAGVDLHAPFGGLKDSSFGPREQGRAARDFYTATRTISVAG